MAEHRGLKLVKSRRRKAGVGDYGMFGLSDASGKPLLGIGDDGLTASPRDIAEYLRAGTLGNWQESANSAPDRPAPKPQPSSKAAAPVKPKARARPDRPQRRPAPAPKVAPAPEPRLVVRHAGSSDADAIARLLKHLGGTAIDGETARRNLAATRRAGGGLLLAELGEPIACCGWAVVQTVQRGPIGRITMVFVARDHRQKGIASQLLAAAELALAGKGCAIVEAMSDIQIANAHNFFRALKFEQTSYRFTRKLVAPT